MHKLRRCACLLLTQQQQLAFAFTGFRHVLPFAEEVKPGSKKMVKAASRTGQSSCEHLLHSKDCRLTKVAMKGQQIDMQQGPIFGSLHTSHTCATGSLKGHS